MDQKEKQAFIQLFRAICSKCFTDKDGDSSLTEAECKHLSNEIYDQTGLVIGWKSLKNYSLFVKEPGEQDINPSIPTLDTLARYLADAPKTDEINRKKYESHFPYWYKFRDGQLTEAVVPVSVRQSGRPARGKLALYVVLPALLLISGALVYFYPRKAGISPKYDYHFSDVSDLSFSGPDWILKYRNDSFWMKRNVKPGHLTLFTSKGDNVPSSEGKQPVINNLLLHRTVSDCFTTEVHFTSFIPDHNWQQAGLLLMEDSLLTSRSVRISIQYNNFFGGFQGRPEINLQVIATSANDNYKPEQIAQVPLFILDSVNKSIVAANLARSAIRVEKKGNRFRFLFTSGSGEPFAFREITTASLDIHPRYIGLYASSGNADTILISPVYIDRFSLISDCNH